METVNICKYQAFYRCFLISKCFTFNLTSHSSCFNWIWLNSRTSWNGASKAHLLGWHPRNQAEVFEGPSNCLMFDIRKLYAIDCYSISIFRDQKSILTISILLGFEPFDSTVLCSTDNNKSILLLAL